METENFIKENEKQLTKEDIDKLDRQDSRLVPSFKVSELEKHSKKYWDQFYKRNETRFFKDRHWTVREFEELVQDNAKDRKTVFEIGCGVGNFIFPLVEENLNFYILACDLSPRAIEMVHQNSLYSQNYIKAFQCDITSDDVFNEVAENSVNIVTLIFVLSAIHPQKFSQVLKNIWHLLKPGAIVLFRDYGLYDMAQLRFKAGHKITENFYMRQDGTTAYYFSTKFLNELFTEAGYEIISNNYVHRRTVNKKENLDVPRIFVQCKLMKPLEKN